MTQELQELRKEIEKTRQRLNSLEHRLMKMQHGKVGVAEDQRIFELDRQIRKKYPNLEIDREVLAMVGTLQNLSVSKDKELIRKVIAVRHG